MNNQSADPSRDWLKATNACRFLAREAMQAKPHPDALLAAEYLLKAEALERAHSQQQRNSLRVEFHQHDWIEGFAAFLPSATTPSPDSTAFCVLNVGSFLGTVETGDLPREELPYFIAESMMHEVIHVLEQWAGVEFSEERVEALLHRYRDSDRSGEAVETTGSTEGDSAGPTAIAQPSSVATSLKGERA